MTRECPHCGGVLDNRGRARRGRVDARCARCGDLFEQRNQNHRYCSRTCQLAELRQPLTECDACGILTADPAHHECRWTA